MSTALDMNSKDINNAQVIKTVALQISGESIVPGSTLTVPTAASVPNVPAGLIVATDVQAALNELDTEKMALAEAQTVTGDKTFSGANAFSGVNVFSNINTFTGAIATDSPVVHRAVVANHVRAGNTQILSGEVASGIDFFPSSAITEDVFESVGPTGSGATNIWATMDVIPPEATILIVVAEIAFSPSGTGLGSVALYATHGDDSTPSKINSNIIHLVELDFDAAVTGNSKFWSYPLYIPLGATNQDFLATWTTIAASNAVVTIKYRGFMTD